MTAKESLHEVVDEMTEAEAEQLLERVRREPLATRVPWLRGHGDNAATLRLLHEWWKNPPEMSQAELAELDEVLRNPEPVRFRDWRP